MMKWGGADKKKFYFQTSDQDSNDDVFQSQVVDQEKYSLQEKPPML